MFSDVQHYFVKNPYTGSCASFLITSYCSGQIFQMAMQLALKRTIVQLEKQLQNYELLPVVDNKKINIAVPFADKTDLSTEQRYLHNSCSAVTNYFCPENLSQKIPRVYHKGLCTCMVHIQIACQLYRWSMKSLESNSSFTLSYKLSGASFGLCHPITDLLCSS